MQQVGYGGALWVSVADAAEFLECSPQAVWSAMRRGRLAYERRAGVMWVSRDDVLAYRHSRRPWSKSGVQGGAPAAERMGVSIGQLRLPEGEEVLV